MRDQGLEAGQNDIEQQWKSYLFREETIYSLSGEKRVRIMPD